MFGVSKRRLRSLVALLAVVVMGVGCGGGGESGAISTSNPLPTLVQDDFPAGARSPVPSDLFALAVGDSATFRKLNAGGNQFDTVRRAVMASPKGPSYVIVSDTDSSGTEVLEYIRDTSGLSIDFTSDSSLPAAARDIIGALVEYPSPLFGAGSTRSSLRQGSWGQDLNGDGVPESFRFRFTQIFRGFETVTFSGKAVSVAHFTNTIAFSIFSSRTIDSPVQVVSIEESYFAEGYGLVKQEVRTTDGNGTDVEPPYTLELQDSIIGGRSWNDYLLTDGTKLQLNLVHTAAVFDADRNVYYASVPSTYRDESGLSVLTPPGANSIATVDASTGNIVYSAPIGASPSTLAMSADGSALYVGMLNAPEIVRVDLPSMSVTHRISLSDGEPVPQPQFAQHIQASPVHPTMFAVSIGNSGGDSYAPNRSVVLVRDMVVQPDRINGPARANAISFDASGTTVFGIDFFNSPPTASSFDVTGTGLTALNSQSFASSISFPSTLWLDHVAGSLVFSRFFLSSTTFAAADLASGVDCRALTNAKVVCLKLVTDTAGFIVSKSLVPIALPSNIADAPISFGAYDGSAKVHISSAVAGRVAVSEARGALTQGSPFTRMTMFRSPMLQ